MIHTFRLLWQRNKWLMIAFMASAALMLFFAGSAAKQWLYWNDPAHRNQVIQGWMTPRYVMNSWSVPPRAIADVLGLDPENRPPRPLNLDQIAYDLDIPTATLIAQLTIAIQDFKDQRQ